MGREGWEEEGEEGGEGNVEWRGGKGGKVMVKGRVGEGR